MKINYWNKRESRHIICYQDFYPKQNLIEYIYLHEEVVKDELPKECVGIWRIKKVMEK